MKTQRAANPTDAVCAALCGDDAPLQALLATTFRYAAQTATEGLIGGSVSKAAPDIADVQDAAVEWAAERSALMITDLTTQQTQAVQTVVARAVQRGWTDSYTAQQINKLIGLTQQQVTAVDSYRAGMLAEGIPPGTAQKRADKYAQRLQRERAKLIAPNEIRAAYMAGQRMAWKNARDIGDVSPYAVRIVRTAKDDRRCSICKPLNGARTSLVGGTYPVKVRGTLVNMDGPPFHPNCRCIEVLQDLPMGDVPAQHPIQKDDDMELGDDFAFAHLFKQQPASGDLHTDQPIGVVDVPAGGGKKRKKKRKKRLVGFKFANMIVIDKVKDGDGDGFVYDGTPRKRPATPAEKKPAAKKKGTSPVAAVKKLPAGTTLYRASSYGEDFHLSEMGESGPGFYTTDKKSVAEKYHKAKSDYSKSVIHQYKVKKPLNLLDRSTKEGEAIFRELARDPDTGAILKGKEGIARYKAAGYDGVLFPGTSGEREIVIHSPESVGVSKPRTLKTPDKRSGERTFGVSDERLRSGYRAATKEDLETVQKMAGKKIPPAWSDLQVPESEDSDNLLVGYDAKGRRQVVQKPEAIERNAAAKFERVRELHKHIPLLDKELETEALLGGTEGALALIRYGGLRPGSDTDTGAEKKAYGATNMLARHATVSEDGKSVHIKMTGKKGVALDLTIEHPVAVAAVQTHLEGKDPDEPLFNTNGARVAKALKSIVGDEFKVKDLRTYVATSLAYDLVRSEAAPTDAKDFAKKRREIGKKVSDVLGNTPSMALNSYISPLVFAGWQNAWETE